MTKASLFVIFTLLEQFGHHAMRAAKKMSQSDHTTNFHDYVIISVHICLYFVSVAQFFAKLILSVAQFSYHKVF